MLGFLLDFFGVTVRQGGDMLGGRKQWGDMLVLFKSLRNICEIVFVK